MTTYISIIVSVNMVKDSIGVIVGKTGTLEFKFLVSESTAVERGEYIKIWHETDGWVLAQVVSLISSSDNFSFEEAKNGKRPDRNEENIIGDVTVIGSRNKTGLLRAPTIPFSPGDKIYKADNKLICSVLGLYGKDMYMGLLDGTGIPVNLSVNSLVQKHCSILAKTGSGKSYTASVLLEEQLDNKIPLLIIDPHSEYSSLKKEGSIDSESQKKYQISSKGYGSKIKVYTPANKAINQDADEVFRINGMNLSVRDIISIFPDNSTNTHVGILYEAVQKVRAEMESYSLDDVIFEVANNESKARWNVVNYLEEIRDTEILSPNPTSIEGLIEKGKASIIDFKGVPPNIQGMLVSHLCTSLFEARKLNKIPPMMLVIEEAHNFAPERGFSKTPSSEILRTIASEGRKFGLGLMVISQRPARIDKNILSQCGTQIIMKVTNPNDLKSISKGLEGVTSYVEEELKRLPPGIAMLVSNEVERPILIDVRTRKTKHGGESVDVVETNKKYKSTTINKVEQSPSSSEETVANPPPKRRPTRKSEKSNKGILKKFFGANK